MNYYENDVIELKEKYVDDIKKEVIAFANCKGGKIFVGVSDDVEGLLCVSETTAYRILDKMVKNGLIYRENSGKNTKYYVD